MSELDRGPASPGSDNGNHLGPSPFDPVEGLFRDFDCPSSSESGSQSDSHGSQADPGRRSLAGPDRTHSCEWAIPGEDANAAVSAGPLKPRFPDVPGYLIVEELGRGAMGVVYRALQVRLKRPVALKMILAGDHASADSLQRFLAEATTVARLQHPNVVQIYAIGDHDGRPYVELEFVEGGSLAAQLDGSPRPPRSAAWIVERVARAIAEAHRLGIVHRDVKPGNILMTCDGEPKISDFGLAKSLEQDVGMTRTESILGSPCYMAPEQAAGRHRETGTASDVYSLGATLYEILTGRPPFVASSILATLDLVKHADPTPPHRLVPGLPKDIETICLKCLEKEPRRRYGSADELADDLKRFLDQQSIQARPPSRWAHAARWARRRPTAAVLIAMIALGLISAAAGGVWHRAEVMRQARALQLQTDRMIALGRADIERKDWEGARARLNSVLLLCRGVPRLARTRGDAEQLLSISERGIAERQRREAAQARIARFRILFDEAVFHQSGFTGLEHHENLQATRVSAREALELYGRLEDTGSLPVLGAAEYTPEEAAEIRTRYYELVLTLAGTVGRPLAGEDPSSQARAGLRILECACRVRPPTAAYHLLRAGLLEALGDRDAAGRERRLSAAVVATARTPLDDFVAGEDAYLRHETDEAAADFRRTLAFQPDHFWAHYFLAVCFFKAHRHPEAQAELRACQTVRAKFVWTYLLKGFSEGETRDYDLAESDFRRAEELGLDDQERYVMLVNRGAMRVRRGTHHEAIEDLEAAVKLRPGQFQAYVNLAQAYQAVDRRDQALTLLDRAIGLAPGQAVLYRARSRNERLLGRTDAALADLDQAVRHTPAGDPALAEDHLTRSVLLREAGQTAKALAACDQAIATCPERPDGYRLRGALLLELKHYDEAVTAFTACLDRGGGSPSLYEARGLARAWGGAYSEAVHDYTLALDRGPGTASLYANRGWAYLLGGAAGPALRDFDEAVRREPENGRFLGGRAAANIHLREVRQAVNDARASARLAPADSSQLYSAARVLCSAAAAIEANPSRYDGGWAAAGRYRDESLDLITRALQLTPERDRLRFWAEVVRNDQALAPIRNARRFVELAALVPAPRSSVAPKRGSGQ